MKQPFIIGKKIYLRPLTARDINSSYLKWVNDPEVNKYLMSGIMPTTMQELREYYRAKKSSKTDIMLAIVVKRNDKHIGNIKIGGIDWVNRSAHCGRLIGDKRYWGKGYGTEALGLVIDYVFDRLNLNRLYNVIVADNIRAIKSCEKLGMKKEGVFLQAKFLDGEYKDVVQMAITKDHYTQIKSKRQLQR